MNTLVIVLIAAVLLSCAYVFYGRWLANKWGIDPKAETPAKKFEDGKDYVPTDGWTVFSHQFSSIAGAGPVTGAIQAAVFGWVPVFLWIIVGGIFFGAVTDFGALYASVKNEGKSMGLLIEKYIGKFGRKVFLLFCWLFTLLVIAAFADMVAGTFNAYTEVNGVVKLADAAKTNGAAGTISLLFIVFAMIFGLVQKKFRFHGWKETVVGLVFTVAALGLGMLAPITATKDTWTYITFVYIFFTAVLPMWILKQPRDTMTTYMFIGMIAGAALGLLVAHPTMNLPVFTGFHNDTLGDMFPILFVTVACGAVSGFHSTQSPLMARCLKNEHMARPVFYGAMVAEGVIALVWAAAGVTFYESTGGLMQAMADVGQNKAVYEICVGFMGYAGAVMAMLGVIACPITSGDTAFRSARLTLADWIGMDQSNKTKRLYLAVPLLAVGGLLSQINFTIVWRYFAWTNQTLAMIVLWTGAVYMYRKFKGSKAYLVAAIPATFMSVVTTTYILQAKEGLQLPTTISYPMGFVFAAIFLFLFLRVTVLRKES